MVDGFAERVEADVAEDRVRRHRELRDIFVSVTGAEGFTETQEQQTDSRYLIAEDSLSEPVTAIARDDGLSDTFSDLEYSPEDE